jgi:Protein of unknown function (DUF3570)
VAAAVAINLNINFHDTLMKSHPSKKTHALGAALFAAAMALPFSNAAFAEAAPEKGIVAFKYLNYKDSQPDADRMSVNAYTVSAMAPIAGKWSISTSYTYDSVTGASPEYHSDDVHSGASIREQRYAGDLSVTRYLPQGSVTVGSSYSEENDYISRGYSAQANISTEDKNTTFAFGGSYTTDTINSSNSLAHNMGKRTVGAMVGVTQVLTKQDIVQLDLGYSKGRGYFNDPYKYNDIRPDRRESKTVMTRWNHHFDGPDGTSHLSYRFYTDSFGIRAHTFGLEYLQSLPNEWTVTPSVRFYSQTAADFYLPVDPADPRRDSYVGGFWPYSPGLISLDQRLSSYGALTLGIKVSKRIAKDWLVDLKYENYKQRARWSMTGGGDSGLKPFNATFVQAGLSREF